MQVVDLGVSDETTASEWNKESFPYLAVVDDDTSIQISQMPDQDGKNFQFLDDEVIEFFNSSISGDYRVITCFVEYGILFPSDQELDVFFATGSGAYTIRIDETPDENKRFYVKRIAFKNDVDATSFKLRYE